MRLDNRQIAQTGIEIAAAFGEDDLRDPPPAFDPRFRTHAAASRDVEQHLVGRAGDARGIEADAGSEFAEQFPATAIVNQISDVFEDYEPERARRRRLDGVETNEFVEDCRKGNNLRRTARHRHAPNEQGAILIRWRGES